MNLEAINILGEQSSCSALVVYFFVVVNWYMFRKFPHILKFREFNFEPSLLDMSEDNSQSKKC